MDNAVASAAGEKEAKAPAAPPTKAVVAVPSRAKKRNFTMLPVGGAMFLLGLGSAMLWNRHVQNAPVAIVNGEAISSAEFAHRLEVGGGANVLQQMIDERLQAQLAAKQGVTPSETFIESKYAEKNAQPGFAEGVKKSRETPEDVKAGLRNTLTAQALLSKGVSVTDEDIRRFYAVNTDPRNTQASYYHPETARVAAIISDKPDDIRNALHDLASGVAFTQAAAKYSKDQSRANNGVLPDIRRGSLDAQKLPGLEAAVLALKPGQQIDTFKTPGALWIIRCMEHADEVKIPFEKVKEECREGALLTKGAQTNGQTLQAQLQAFHRDAKIDLPRPEYKDAININVK